MRPGMLCRGVAIAACAWALAFAARAADPAPPAPETETAQPATTPPEPAPPAPPQTAWAERFNAWIERELVAGALREASESVAQPDPDRAFGVIDALVRDHVLRLADELPLPAEARPPLVARDVTGKALEAARLWATGAHEDAMRLLDEAASAGDPVALHLRAELLDETQRDAPAADRLDAIARYRHALGGLPDGLYAERARLRIGQIYLEIRFHREAVSALHSFLERWPQSELALAARLSLSEAAYRDRQYQAALDALAEIALDSLAPEGRVWLARRRGDALLRLGRFGPAIASYDTLETLLPEGARPEPLVLLRAALAGLEEGPTGVARPALEKLLAQSPGGAIENLGRLLYVRALRREKEWAHAMAAAAELCERVPGTRAAALAASEVLENGRRAGRKGELPPSAAGLGDPRLSEEHALLSYLLERGDVDAPLAPAGRERVGQAVLRLPNGPVRTLAREELGQRIAVSLGAELLAGRLPDDATLDVLRRVVRPHQLDEDVLLLGVEAFWRRGDADACRHWAAELGQREVRPIRRGVAAWRMVRCEPAGGADPRETQRLLAIADGGEAGPFSLAIASLAAEAQAAAGERARAIEVYERAVESLAEPRLLGPALVRLGELLEQDGRAALALPRLSRGLALLDARDPDEPFRKVAIVALARASAPSGRSEALRVALAHEVPRAQDWWADAYRYLGQRVGAAPPPEGDGVFARAARELGRAEQTGAEVARATARAAASLADADAPEGAP
jgi:tetratricopeptide (TPR) repeat protein